ncbi:MAG: hypothetical protein JSV00_04805 [bacterium]|nr:MAG: hypothetical protein JSV00_04805 [bacterium]
MGTALLYVGAVIIVAWGVGHHIPTPGIVRGFGPLSEDNRRIITMEWVAEGLTLCFIGLLVLSALVTAGPGSRTVVFTARACASMLVVLAILSRLTGGRTSILPMRLCPYVKTVVAVTFLYATL